MKPRPLRPAGSTVLRVVSIGAILVLLVLAALRLRPRPEQPAVRSPAPTTNASPLEPTISERYGPYTADAGFRVQCEAQLRSLGEALSGYHAEHHRYPDLLSALYTNPLERPELVCPYVRTFGDRRNYMIGFREDTFKDQLTTYSYEFINIPMSTFEQGFGLEDATWREYKKRQQERLGDTSRDIVPIVRCFAHRPVLNLTPSGRIYPSQEHWEDDLSGEVGHMELLPSLLFRPEIESRVTQLIPPTFVAHTNVPPRSANAKAHHLDLSQHYNALLTETWHGDHLDNDLKELGVGLLQLHGVQWDLRGVLQLRSTQVTGKFPFLVSGIPAQQKCERLHFLHGTSWSDADAALIGEYTIHYEDGSTASIPIRYGIDVEDWWYNPEESFATTNRVAWQGDNPATQKEGRRVRIYHMVWENPWPEKTVTTLDMSSKLTMAAPFLLAITLE